MNFSSSSIESAATAAAIIASSPTSSTSSSSSPSDSAESSPNLSSRELFIVYYRRVTRVIQAYLTDEDNPDEIRFWSPAGQSQQSQQQQQHSQPKKRLDKSVPPNSVLTELTLTDSIDSLFDRLFLFLDSPGNSGGGGGGGGGGNSDHYSNPAYLDHLALTLNCWWVIFYDVTRYSEFIVSTLRHTVNTLVRACSAQLRLFWTDYYDRMPGDEDGRSALELIVTTVGYLLENVLRSPQFNACELVDRETLYELIKTVLPYQVIHVRICSGNHNNKRAKHPFPFSFYLVDDLLMNILFEFDYHQYRHYLNQTDVLIVMIRLMMDFSSAPSAPSSAPSSDSGGLVGVVVDTHKDLYLELLTKYFQKAAAPATEQSEHDCIVKLNLKDILVEIQRFLQLYSGPEEESSAAHSAREAVKHFVKSLIDRKGGPDVIWANFGGIQQELLDRQGENPELESLELIKYLRSLGVDLPTPEELRKAQEKEEMVGVAGAAATTTTPDDLEQLQARTQHLSLNPRDPRPSRSSEDDQDDEDTSSSDLRPVPDSLVTRIPDVPLFGSSLQQEGEDPVFSALGTESKDQLLQAVVQLQQNLIKGSRDELKKIINNVHD